jgi:hypothetical protein
MWFNSMKGIKKITIHNLISSGIAGILLCFQKGETNVVVHHGAT